MHKLIILCVVTSLTSVLASQSVTVEERAISLFENLSSQCRENIKLLKDAQCKWTINVNDMTVYEDRRTNCVNNMRQRHEMCMRRIARCEQAEVDTFLQRLCDFDQYTKVNRLQRKFSKECGKKLKKKCYVGETQQYIDIEDFCTAYEKDGELEECFEDIDECDNDEDEENFDKIRHLACGCCSIIYNIILLVMCALFTIITQMSYNS